LGDAWLEVFQQVLPRNQFCAAGKLVARAYREEFGEEPPRRQQFVDGAPRQVKSYRRSWLIDTLKRFRAQLTGGSWTRRADNSCTSPGLSQTAEACAALGMSRETLRQLRLRGVLTPGKHYRRWGCTQGRGGHCSGIWRTWRPPSPAGAGGICSTERHKPGVESRLYRWP